MKRLLLSLLAALALPTAVNANVDPKVHKLCLPAADYLGCVKAMTTNSTDIPTMRMIDGGVELSGNSCPMNIAYLGGGICREVKQNIRVPYNPQMIGLMAAGWEPELGLLAPSVGLELGVTAKAVIDPKCPNKESYIYIQNLPAIQNHNL